jgi:hypothetical protein
MPLAKFPTQHLNPHSSGISKELVDRIPGRQTDRKTPLGELNWIFTAITDTIAWNCLPRALFQKLFRQVTLTYLSVCPFVCHAICPSICLLVLTLVDAAAAVAPLATRCPLPLPQLPPGLAGGISVS